MKENLAIHEVPNCPHCGQKMNKWETPQFAFSDGLGWGSSFLYVCVNNDCSLYDEGWRSMMDNYGQVASYRCICDPTTGNFECMPVYTPHGMLGNIVDEEEVARKKAEEKALSDLLKYRESEDIKSILNLLLDEKALPAARKKAAEYLEEIGDLKSIEPVRNYSFEDAELEKKVNHAIEMIHKANYTKECPFCAEIIKARAKVCKHCKRDV